MSATNLALALGAVTVLVLGLGSGFIKNRLWISEPLIATLIGIAVGPAVFEAAAFTVPKETETTILLEVARVTLAISVMGAALRLPPRWESENWRELAVVLGLGMPLMWLASGTLALWVLGVPVLYAFLIGAVLSPTDPVLADSIVAGDAANKAIPARMRYAITAESGANDGLALLIVMLPVYLLGAAPSEAVPNWALEVLLRKVVAGIAVGFVLGWLSARVFVWVLAKDQSERPSILTISLSLTLAVLGIDLLLGTASLLAVFTAGLVFNRSTPAHEGGLHENMQTAVARFFDIPIFIFIGTLLPWQGWLGLGWPGVGFAVAVLLLRRLPAWLLLRPLLASLRNWRETAFNGWFGPIGIAAVFYAMELHKEPNVENPERIWHVVSLVVFCSILLHGISATPLTRLFGRDGGADPDHETGAEAKAERLRRERTGDAAGSDAGRSDTARGTRGG